MSGRRGGVLGLLGLMGHIGLVALAGAVRGIACLVLAARPRAWHGALGFAMPRARACGEEIGRAHV